MLLLFRRLEILKSAVTTGITPFDRAFPSVRGHVRPKETPSADTRQPRCLVRTAAGGI